MKRAVIGLYEMNKEFWRKFFFNLKRAAAIYILLTSLGFIFTLLLWLSERHNMCFSQAFYQTLISAVTIGFGDVAPKTSIGKVIVIFECLVGIFFFGLTTAIFVKTYEDVT